MPHYPPLYMADPPEDDRGRLRRWLSDRRSDAERHLLHQIAVRGSVPSEVWGGNPDREILARELTSIIADVFQLPNSNFIPEDPVKWLTHIVGWDDLEHTELAIRLEDAIGVSFSDAEFDLFQQGTLGEFVDYLLIQYPEYTKVSALSRPYPLVGAGALESRPCPKLSAFLDLRWFIGQSRFKNSTKIVNLDTLIRRMPGSISQFDVHRYICTRFGLSTSPLAFDSGADGVALGLTATVLSTLPFAGLCLYATMTSPPDTDGSMWIIPLCIAGLGFGITAIFAIPHLLRAVLNVSRGKQKKRIRTLRDLVTWIVEERSRLSRDLASER